jgi:sec-independent protein translocase protein TatC
VNQTEVKKLEENYYEEKENPEEKEMSFIDHLEELRWHIIRSVGSIVVFAIIAFFSKHFVFHVVLLGPSRPDFWTYRMLCKLGAAIGTPGLCVDKLDFTMQSRDVGGQFTTHITTAAVIGLICAFPYTFWEIWRFIRPGLHPTERKAASGATFFVTVLFMMGIAFGYFIISPLTINFLANYKLDESIVNEFDILSYFSTLVTLTLACGAMFQLPIVAFFLSKAGVINPRLMREYRKHAYVVILVIAAIITPSPDVISQILVAMPLFLLYEVSITVSGNVVKQKMKALAAAEKEFLP